MTTYIKLRIDLVTNNHVHCSIFEGEGEGPGTFTYAKNGTLIFSKNTFWAFRDSLERGRGTRTWIEIEDVDMKERLDWEAANRSQS